MLGLCRSGPAGAQVDLGSRYNGCRLGWLRSAKRNCKKRICRSWMLVSHLQIICSGRPGQNSVVPVQCYHEGNKCNRLYSWLKRIYFPYGNYSGFSHARVMYFLSNGDQLLRNIWLFCLPLACSSSKCLCHSQGLFKLWCRQRCCSHRNSHQNQR